MTKLINKIKGSFNLGSLHFVSEQKMPANTFSNTDIAKAQAGFYYPSSLFTLK